MIRVILLGAEGCAETEDVDWIRDPTENELSVFKRGLGKRYRRSGASDEAVYEKMLRDDNGRPYWPKAVLSTAPTKAWQRAGAAWRVVRL